ncbi:hypothetical protein [Pseudoduganella violacea]|uniref:Uncharacterized protein n=1 Tax=Pseudoduganella violacea TaxID=1715466 RepID=A0A7W5B9C9_9BURK|nr:hypothetical protein [Pseudoduganella violacea]MBB3118796.1 hypothetical protein [Pseudoduganella violacea]
MAHSLTRIVPYLLPHYWPTQMILVAYSCAADFFFAAQVMASSAWAIVITVAFSLFLMKETPSNTPSLLRMTLAKTGGLLLSLICFAEPGNADRCFPCASPTSSTTSARIAPPLHTRVLKDF